eukprot:9109891-Pyramimonas_sp.AAC.1
MRGRRPRRRPRHKTALLPLATAEVHVPAETHPEEVLLDPAPRNHCRGTAMHATSRSHRAALPIQLVRSASTLPPVNT